MFHGIRIDTDGGVQAVVFDGTTSEARAAAIREQVGCRYFDVVRLTQNIDVWVDDEGLYNSVANPELSRIVRAVGPGQQVIYGAGFFLGVDPDTGDTLSLTPTQVATVITWWRNATTIPTH
jgi:hypothetical protein